MGRSIAHDGRPPSWRGSTNSAPTSCATSATSLTGRSTVREEQASPLASVEATSARVYVTGNHEYFNEAQGWLDYMESIGWDALHNRHIIVERDGDRLIIAGVDDATAKSSGIRGHGANLEAALTGADPTLPVLLLAHQPKQVAHAAAGRRRSPGFRAHSRRPDLAVQLPCPTGSTGGSRPESTR